MAKLRIWGSVVLEKDGLLMLLTKAHIFDFSDIDINDIEEGKQCIGKNNGKIAYIHMKLEKDND